MFSLIVARDYNYGIGYNGKIPWHNSDDLEFFKQTTLNTVVIMGRKTFESIGKPLVDRVNIVISKNTEFIQHLPAGVIGVSSPDLAVIVCRDKFPNKKHFVIGGSKIYKWFIENELINEMYISEIEAACNVDTYFNVDLVNWNSKMLKQADRVKMFLYVKRNTEELQFLQLMGKTLKGNVKTSRTSVNTRSVFGERLTFSLLHGQFPLLTTRPMFLRGIFEELMFNLRGQTDTKILEKKSINVWKGNTSREFLDSKKLFHLKEGDMGPSYGFLFRHFGAEYISCDTDYKGKGFDQVAYVIDKLKNNHDDRRIMINLWDPRTIDQCALPPCLYNYQFYVNGMYLSCMMTQRSSDIAVAGGWNIAAGALLTILLAKVCNLEPKELIWNIGDVHIYDNLVEQVVEQIKREPFQFPRLVVNKKEEITDYEFGDLELIGYQHLPAIKMVMNA